MLDVTRMLQTVSEAEDEVRRLTNADELIGPINLDLVQAAMLLRAARETLQRCYERAKLEHLAELE